MVVRDEEDIIAQCLDHLLKWADGIYIHDLGSTDSTWDIVQDYARRDKRVIPYRREPLVYNDSLRCVLFDEYRQGFDAGDWVMKIDADEFYHIEPPVFVRERLSKLESAIYLRWYFFRLTSAEVADYESGRVNLRADRSRPIERRRWLYKIPEYAEPRMFRYRRTIRWATSTTMPHNAGYVARECIPIRHYPHRDPLQMAKRYRLRRANVKLKGASPVVHWSLDDWRKDLLQVDPVTRVAVEQTGAGEGLSAAAGHTAGELHEWIDGTKLPEFRGADHLQRWPKRMLQRIVHPLLLPLLDARREQFDRTFVHARIPDELTRELRDAYAAEEANWRAAST